MSDYEQASFSVERNGWGDLRIMWTGAQVYAALFKTVFPNVRVKSVFKARYGGYDFGLYADISAADEIIVRKFCNALSNALWLKDDLDQSFALAIHGSYPNGQFQRSPMGDLVYGAKPYDKPVTETHRAYAQQIASSMVAFIESCPIYKSADAIAAVPPSNPDKLFDLPTYIVAEIARLTKKTDVSRGIRKTRRTLPMKDLQTDTEKASNISGAFQADPKMMGGKTIILVDDIYDSGQSINEACRTIRGSGTLAVLGLTATKTNPRA